MNWQRENSYSNNKKEPCDDAAHFNEFHANTVRQRDHPLQCEGWAIALKARARSILSEIGI